MCQIIHRLPGTPSIDDRILLNASRYNNDGWGIMYHDKDNKKVIKRGLVMTDSIEAIREAESLDSEFAAHFRLGTHGSKLLENVHPFSFFDETHALMHNGIFNVDYGTRSGKSDTAQFVEILDKFPRHAFATDSFVVFLHNLMKASSNKVIIFYDTNNFGRYGQWYKLTHEEYTEKYEGKLFFSTSPVSYDYDPRNVRRYDFTSDFYYRGCRNDDNVIPLMGQTTPSKENDPNALHNKLFRIGDAAYHLEDLIELDALSLGVLASEDPSGCGELLKSLVEFSHEMTSKKG